MFSMQRSRLYDEVKEVHPVVGAVAVEIMIDEVDLLPFGIQSEAIFSRLRVRWQLAVAEGLLSGILVVGSITNTI